MAKGESGDALLPVSWDEGRELLAVALLAAAMMYLLSPVVQVIDGGSPGGLGDDLAVITRNVSPTMGLMLVGAAVLIATTPPADVVPVLRQVVLVLTAVVVGMGIVAITVELTRPSPAGVLPRIETILGRSGPGSILAGIANWLASRVVPFPPQ